MATTTDPPTTEELEEARDRLRHEKLKREFAGDPDGKLFDIPSELSFNVGMGRNAEPDFASVKITGSMRVERDLLYSEHVTVTITDAHGEVIVSRPATVDFPTFKSKDGLVERIHTAAID